MAWGQTKTDVMTAADLPATGNTYTDFSGVKLTSDAVYAGNSAKDASGNIQLRSKNSNSGIVTTVSGGKILTVKINVASGTNTIDVYGSNTAYTSAADLYNTSKQGEKLGSLTATGTISVTGDYKYVGIRSNNNALYLSSIEFTWNTSTAAAAAAPTFSPAGGTYTEAQSVTITSTTEGAAIYYTLDGSTPSTSSTKYTGPVTISKTATIKAIATKSGMNNSAVNSADYTILNAADAMTVEEGIAYTKEGSTGPIMVKGIISKIDGLVGGTSITYWISDDGTTTTQMEVFKGKGLNGADFSAVTDLTVGDKVVVYGKVKMYNSIPEFDSGSILLSHEEDTETRIIADDVNLKYDDTEGTIEVDIQNPGMIVSVTADLEDGCTWISNIDVKSNVTFTTTVNESTEPRSATITLHCTGAQDKVVTIIQAGAPLIYDDIATMDAAATTTETEVLVKFGGWVVTGVSTNGKNVYVSDGTNGFIIFDSNGNLGFEVGNTLTSTSAIKCKLLIYNGFPEIKGLTATTEGLTIGTAEYETFAAVAMKDLQAQNTGALVCYVNLTCSVTDGKYYLTDGTTTLQVFNSLYADALKKLEAGKTYNITGVYQQFNNTKEILPRYASDIEEIAILSEVLEVEIGESGYATLYCSDVDLAIPDDVTVTYVTDLEGTKLVTAELTEAIPAGTGVILQGEPGSYGFEVLDPELEPIEGNMLFGTDEDEMIEGSSDYYYYKLVNESDGVGFWWGNEDGGPFVNGANKAYLRVAKSLFDSSSPAKVFYLFGGDGGVSTGINNVEKIAEGAAIYNLNGVRVNKMQKGVYVVNGKKVVIK